MSYLVPYQLSDVFFPLIPLLSYSFVAGGGFVQDTTVPRGLLYKFAVRFNGRNPVIDTTVMFLANGLVF